MWYACSRLGHARHDEQVNTCALTRRVRYSAATATPTLLPTRFILSPDNGLQPRDQRSAKTLPRGVHGPVQKAAAPTCCNQPVRTAGHAAVGLGSHPRAGPAAFATALKSGRRLGDDLDLFNQLQYVIVADARRLWRAETGRQQLR